MTDILYTYHPTADGTRGVHLLTTHDGPDRTPGAAAIAMQRAEGLQKTMIELCGWENAILEALAAKMGETSAQYQSIAQNFRQADSLLHKKGAAP